MIFARYRIHPVVVLAAVLAVITVCGCRRHKYENPITKATDQPDKVLFDKAINDIERGRFEIARLTLNTLINTYDTSEYLAKAKLAIADSWYREGGSHAWAQAEAEYKDFRLFYPTMEESAESQEKVCLIHYKQMEKPDRDRQQAIRAEDECRQLLIDYPNSKFAPEAQQMLRNVQEVLAEGEYKAAMFYRGKAAYVAAANRLQYLVDQYPLFSKADEALWQLADSYTKMGDRFEDRAAATYTRIVKDYPLSDHAEDATQTLKDMNRPVPEADPVAYARMKYELENRQKEGVVGHVMGMFKHSPDARAAAKSGTPAMATARPPVPLSVPAAVTGTAPGAGGSDVSVQTVSDSSVLDSKPDARQNPPAANATPSGDGSAAANGAASRQGGATGNPTAAQPAEPASTVTAQPLPTNHQPIKRKKSKKQQKAEAEQQRQQPAQQQPPQQPEPQPK